MATMLYRLGRLAYRRRGAVIMLWLALLLAVGVGAGTLSGQLSNTFSMPSTESSQAFELIKERAPQVSTDGATARLVIQAPQGQQLTAPASQAAVREALKLASTDHVLAASDPFATGTVSKDGRTAYSTIGYDRVPGDLTKADEAAVEKAVSHLRTQGMTAVVGGDAFSVTEIAGVAEGIGVLIAFIVLAITFGSLVAAGMPLLTAVIGVGIGILGVTTLSGFVELSSVTPALASMLGLAVGIDYALFIMSRYQHEVRRGRSREEAAGVAVGTAGSAVVFAGLTVVIALVGLSLTGITFLTQMGLAAAATVVLAVLIALTLLPALLSLTGAWLASGRIPGTRDRDPEGDDDTRTMGRRWVEGVARWRAPALVLGLLAAAVLSVPVASLELALPDDGSRPSSTQPRQAYDLIAENFGAGANGPLTVVVDTAAATDPAAAVDAAVAVVNGVKTDVAAVVPPVPDPTNAAAVAGFAQQLAAVDFAVITVVPASGPSDTSTKELVQTLRDELRDLPSQTGARALVTGQTAAGVDISQSLADAFPKYLAVVVSLAFILLVMVFRSLLVPLKATLGFLLSVGISLGATVAIFQWGWLAGLVGVDSQSPVVFILPLMLTGILFGLAMDYEVFLVSRMREEYVHGREAREAVVSGFTHSARVVTAAALIMVGVFAGFALGDDIIIKSLGLALAIGVAADAFLVRMLLVPALMAVVGRRMWWLPGWLDRILPNVDVEGERLLAHLEPVPQADTAQTAGMPQAATASPEGQQA